jgi:signal transduction histidine kinase
MDKTLVEGLLRVFGFVVFERQPDGTFAPLSALPSWLSNMTHSGTFPFLGGFLAEAEQFWAETSEGRLGSGLCSATDGQGREFHVEAWAVALDGRRFLLFEHPASASRLQEVLQRAREQLLERESLQKTAVRVESTLQQVVDEVRTGLDAIRNLVSASEEVKPGRPARDPLLDAIRVAATTLSARVEGLAGK